MSKCPFHHAAPSGSDPFRAVRESTGVLPTQFQGQPVPMILTHEGVREAARDWRTYSSDAPLRVPIPSEEDVRTVRQLPLEVDLPEHTTYRRLADPFFNRPKDPVMIAAMETLIGGLITQATALPNIEVVHDLAIPLQSRALALLLNVPMSEAEVWIGWGTHVFRDKDGKSKGNVLEDYCRDLLAKAEAAPGDDFFTALTQIETNGRRLTREEQLGYMNIAFAGGRDTIIHTITGVIGHFAAHPEALDGLRGRPELLNTAAEEFFRVLSPITHIGRVCPEKTDVGGVSVPAGERVSLCWASANRDAEVFPEPDVVKLDRKPNPHLAFGSGPHTCLGALHARLLTRTLISTLVEQVAAIHVVDEKLHLEKEHDFVRQHGYDMLRVRFEPRA
jgi:cytochrome P450